MFWGQHKLSNGNRTEWIPIRSVIIQVITKSDNSAAITSMITDRIERHEVLQLIIKISISEKRRIAKL